MKIYLVICQSATNSFVMSVWKEFKDAEKELRDLSKKSSGGDYYHIQEEELR